MNRLLGSFCYLAGPIDRCPDGGRQWRVALTPELQARGIGVFDPLDKPCDVGLEADDQRARRAVWKQAGDFDAFVPTMKTIRAIDLRLVDFAHFLIAKVDTDIHLAGTYEEIYWANRCKRPVLVWCPQGKRHVPDWLLGTLPHQMIFGSLEELMSYVDHVDTAPEVDTLGRWVFLDPLKVYPPSFLHLLEAARGVSRVT